MRPSFLCAPKSHSFLPGFPLALTQSTQQKVRDFYEQRQLRKDMEHKEHAAVLEETEEQLDQEKKLQKERDRQREKQEAEEERERLHREREKEKEKAREREKEKEKEREKERDRDDSVESRESQQSAVSSATPGQEKVPARRHSRHSSLPDPSKRLSLLIALLPRNCRLLRIILV